MIPWNPACGVFTFVVQYIYFVCTDHGPTDVMYLIPAQVNHYTLAQSREEGAK